MTEVGKPATAKELAERLEKARHIMMPGGEWFDTLEVEEVIKGLKALASQPEDKLKALRRTIANKDAYYPETQRSQHWIVTEIDALLATEGTKER